MSHPVTKDLETANALCFSCDNGVATRCKWIDKNIIPDGAIHDENKIYLCPNYERFGEERKEDYIDLISDAYTERVKEIKYLRKKIIEYKAEQKQAYEAVNTFLSALKLIEKFGKKQKVGYTEYERLANKKD